ncbi:hypothetical protein [Kangiella taiwanensis]|uniref:Uncharacterized protein n=1 Tax=Kangiella taiwanensis TaxID=1079179 RepID=A0ABP8I4Z2_9GAMM|nr:hypothetical protein [Kangiella taiwanensis]
MKRIIILILLFWSTTILSAELRLLHDYNNIVENSDSVPTEHHALKPILTDTKVYSFMKTSNDISYGRVEVLSVIDKQNNNASVLEPLNKVYKRQYRGMILKDNLLYLFIQQGSNFDGSIIVWTVNIVTDEVSMVTEVDITSVPQFRSSYPTLFNINNEEILIQPKSNSFSVYNTTTNEFRNTSVKMDSSIPSISEKHSFAVNNNYIYYEFNTERVMRADTGTGESTVLLDKPGFILYLGTFNGRGYFNKIIPNTVIGGFSVYDIYSTDGISVRLEYEGFVSSAGEVYNLKPQVVSNKLILLQTAHENKFLYKNINDSKFASIKSSFIFGRHPLHKQSDVIAHLGSYYILGTTYGEGSAEKYTSIIEVNLQEGFKIISKKETQSSGSFWVYLYKENQNLMLLETMFQEAGTGRFNPLLTTCNKVNTHSEVVEQSNVIDNFKFVSKLHDNSGQYVFAESNDHGVEPHKVSCLENESTLLEDFNKELSNGDSEFTYLSNSNRTFVLYRSLYAMGHELMSYDMTGPTKYDDSDIKSSYLNFDAKLIALDNHYLYLHILMHEHYDFGWMNDLATYFPFALNLKTGDLQLIDFGFAPNFKVHQGAFIHFVSSGPNSRINLVKNSIYGRDEMLIEGNFDDFIPYKEYLLLYGESPQGTYEFGNLKGTRMVHQFEINCESGCIDLSFGSKNSTVLISTAQDDDMGDFYIYNIEKAGEPYRLYNGYKTDVKLLASSSKFSLFNMIGLGQTSGNGDKYLYKFNHSEGSISEVSLEPNSIVKIQKVGNYYVSITEDKRLLVLDKDFNYLKETKVPSSENYSPLSQTNYFECDNGICYLSLERNSPETSRSVLVKFNINLELEHVATVDGFIYSTISKNNHYFLLDAEEQSLGREVFILKRDIVDTDSDGIDDNYEMALGLNSLDSTDGILDADSDGVSNIDEYLLRLNPIDSDTDGDGLTDQQELSYGSNPLEYDLHLVDTDDDGFINSEDQFPFDAGENNDNDYDGIGDNADADDDNDGMPDSWEHRYGLDPLSDEDRDLDPDNDGRTNYQEYQDGTDPTVSNKDGSGGGSPNDGGGSSGGGGGSTPVWLLSMLLLAFTARRYYK